MVVRSTLRPFLFPVYFNVISNKYLNIKTSGGEEKRVIENNHIHLEIKEVRMVGNKMLRTDGGMGLEAWRCLTLK